MNYDNSAPFWRNADPRVSAGRMGMPGYDSRGSVMPGGLPGRVIQNPNDITPGEVDMNGKVSLFPMADYSCIIAKCWNQYGSIDTVRYIPEPQQNQPPAMLPQGQQQTMQEPQVIYQQVPDETQKELLTRLTNIEQYLTQVMQAQMANQQNQSLVQQPQTQDNKKGGKN